MNDASHCNAQVARKVHPNSLLGLLLTLKDQAGKLEVRMTAVEKRLRDEGIRDPLGTFRQVADALSRRPSARSRGGMFVGTEHVKGRH